MAKGLKIDRLYIRYMAGMHMLVVTDGEQQHMLDHYDILALKEYIGQIKLAEATPQAVHQTLK